MNIRNDIKYVGVYDERIDLFEGQYNVPDGITYNSYVILDEKIAVMDTVDAAYTEEWLENVSAALCGRSPDYLIVQHMEPDHSAGIARFKEQYPDATVVASAKAFAMMKGFFGKDFEDTRLVVSDGATLPLGQHELTFITAPMVHWPEVIVTYDSTEKILFSADGFGRFGRADEKEPWADESRRYYIGIVGKYGAQVQALLKKAAALDIRTICPLHGPSLTENLGYYLGLYDKWSSYTPEEEGTTIAYSSVYGNTRAAAEMIAKELVTRGERVALYDLARCDMAEAIASAFRFPRLVLASVTYNGDVFPHMSTYLHGLVERGFKNRTVAFVENGSWAPMAAKVMRTTLESGCKCISFAETTVRINGGPGGDTVQKISDLANELTKR